MTSTTLTAVEIAKLSALITGGGFKRSNSKEAAISRFYNLASKAGITVVDAAAAIEAGDPAAALKLIAEALKAAKKRAAEAKAAAKAGQPAKAIKAPGIRAAVEAAAAAGKLPAAPDFSAETHKPFRKKLADVVALVEAADIEGLKAYPIEPKSSSRKAICRYRDLAVIALQA